MHNKYIGCLIGLAVGDYLGMPVEFASKNDITKFFKGNELYPKESFHRAGECKPAGYYSDDTAMTICLAESLIEKGFDIKDQFSKYKKWLYEGYATPDNSKAFGIGQNTLRVLLSATEDTLETELKHDPKRGGNGALMRSAPLALAYYKDEKLLLENTFKATIITHNNEIAVWTCIAFTSFIRYCLLGFQKETFIKRFLQAYPYAPLDLQNALQTDFDHLDEQDVLTSGYSLHTLTVALYTFLTTTDYESCITRAVFIGGDTDTQATVAGALAGSYYGFTKIPSDWYSTLLRKEYLQELAIRLYEKVID